MDETEIIAILKKYVIKAIMNITVAKSNLTATAEPTASDDDTKGYKEGSTWIFEGTTYTCIDSTANHAVWASTTDIYYFDSWASLVSAISVVGTNYVGKHATVANANGAPSSGLTYTAPDALTDYIVDGGSATLKINAQGENYSVTCQVRTVTNPVVTKVYLQVEEKPTIPGYYIFSVIPIGGLPTGINLNDIAYYNGSAYSVFQTYSSASAVLVAGTTTNTQITWRKFNGTWMSTADDYIPDGNEYQTGKLYNGKAVYRRCISGTTGTSSSPIAVGITADIGTTGIVLLVTGRIRRATGTTITVVGSLNSFLFGSLDNGNVVYQNATGDAGFQNSPYTVWVEYTKS